jgi:hypothetical protein
MFLKKLWRGEYSLPITYWVFNVLIGNLILGNIIALIDPAKNISYFLVGLFLYLAYMITAAVGLWKSASLYKGNVPWGIFAKISVVFGAIILAVSLYTIFSQINIGQFKNKIVLRPECQINQLQEASTGIELSIMVRSIPYCQQISRVSMVKSLGGDVEKNEKQIKEENINPIVAENALVGALVKEKKFSPLGKYKSLSQCQTEELKRLKNVKDQVIYLRLIDEYCDQYIAITGSIKNQYDIEGALKEGYSYKEIANYLDQKYN